MTSATSIAPLIDANMGYRYRDTSREAICLSVAVALHALVFLWNPTILKGAMEKPQNPLVEIGIVDEAGPAPVEPPKKLSLMETLKDMLTKPEAPHINAPTPKTMPIQTPLLQDRSMPRPITNVLHPQTEDELAMAKSPALISTQQKNFKLPDAAPSLQAKSFSGVRVKDLPFETSNETINTAGQAIPIAVGNNSLKNTINYVNPALRDNSRTSLQSKKFFGSTSADTINSASTPIQITGAAPAIAPTNSAPALQETRNTGGGLINRALLGGHTATAALQTIPNSAAQTDQLMDNTANASHLKKPGNGFEIEGKLANRPILKKVIPQYPSWAEEQGIIGTLRLYFTVTPEGTIRSNIKVTKTTGNPQLDQVGIDALKAWLFSPQPSGDDDDVQWGIITFTFSLGS